MMLERALERLARACTMLGAVALAVMMLTTDYDIVARALFRAPLSGAVDIVEMMVLCSAFLGLPEICLRDEQIRVDIIDTLVPPRVTDALKALGLGATIGFMGLLAVNITRPLHDAWQFGDIKPDTGFPLYPLFALVLFCLIAATATTAVVLMRTFRSGAAARA
ncbi:MAG: TRAP transporter small permease [Proteobacteria bacterium]|nr:TRAP transporter small permease [Pseudomonadota bacterium]